MKSTMIKTDVRVTRYEHNEFWIDVVELENVWEVWLSKKDNGASILMFGLPPRPNDKTRLSYGESVCPIIEANLETCEKEYIEIFNV